MKVVVSENDREMVIASRGLEDDVSMGGNNISVNDKWHPKYHRQMVQRELRHTLQASPDCNSSLKCAYRDRTSRGGELHLQKDPIPA